MNKFIVVMSLFNSIFTIIGTIIGAGFASGKEVFTFFNIYGIYGLIGLLVAEALTGVVIFKVFSIIIKNNITSYSDFINKIIHKSNFLNSVICNIINIFLLITFIVMVAGFSAYFEQEFQISHIFGAILICILSFYTFLKNIDGIVKINTYFIPFLVVIILLIGLKNINAFTNMNFQSANYFFPWFISSLLYASYNLIIVVPILITLRKHIKTLNNAKLVSISVSLILFIMAITIFILLNNYFAEIKNLELPTIYIASQLGNVYKYVCGLAILIAIFTTAVSSGYGFLTNLNITNKKFYALISFSICFLSICLSNIGFGTLLNSLYPILGCLGFIQIILIFIFAK